MIAPLAMVLDALLGEPGWLWNKVPHPVVLIGNAIKSADERLNQGSSKRLKGLLLVLILLVGSWIIGRLVELMPGIVLDIIIAAVLIAHKSLVQHVRAVADALSVGLAQARQEVAKIVGRDTSELDEPAIARATLESAAENFSDGVIAPLFWLLVAGIPGIIGYKALNTADSMIGYRNEKYEQFGWAAARLDDVANYIPARLTALLFLLAGNKLTAWQEVLADAPKHRSVNAGWPEAAFAQVLNVSLAGPRSYDGQMRDFAFVNASGIRETGAEHILNGIQLLWRTWAIAVFLAAIISIIA